MFGIVCLIAYLASRDFRATKSKAAILKSPQLKLEGSDIFNTEGSLQEEGEGTNMLKTIGSINSKPSLLFNLPFGSLFRLKKMKSTQFFTSTDVVYCSIIDTGYGYVAILSKFHFPSRKLSTIYSEFSKLGLFTETVKEYSWPLTPDENNDYFDTSLLTIDFSYEDGIRKLTNDSNPIHYFQITMDGSSASSSLLSPHELPPALADDNSLTVDLEIVKKRTEVLALDQHRGKFFWYYKERYYQQVNLVNLTMGTEESMLEGRSKSNFAVSESTVGIMPYSVQMTVASGFTVINGKQLYFTFGSGLNADPRLTQVSQDHVFYDNKEFILEPVEISYDPLNFMNSWSAITYDASNPEDPQTALYLVSERADCLSNSKLYLYRWKVERVFGRWVGSLKVNGTSIQIESALGMAISYSFKY